MAVKLRLACKATSTSQPSPRYSWRMATRWPSCRKRRLQRRAVTRLPLREWGGAGVMMVIFMAAGCGGRFAIGRYHRPLWYATQRSLVNWYLVLAHWYL